MTSVNGALKARIYLKAQLVLKTSALVGCGESEELDIELVRDADGKPYLPGTSLSGATRALLKQRCGAVFDALWGGARGKDDGLMSPLAFSDAHAIGEVRAGMRDGVGIDPRSRTAADKRKYDFEVIPAGTRFNLRLELVIREGDNEDDLRGGLAALVKMGQDGEIRIGAKTMRGLGRCELQNPQAFELKAGQAEALTKWLDAGDPWDLAVSAFEAELPADAGNKPRFHAVLHLRLTDSLLVRSPAEQKDAPDVVQLRDGNNPIVPGTSWAGVLRQRARLIAQTRADANLDETADGLLADLFGPLLPKKTKDEDNDNAAKLRRSRLRVEESTVTGVTDALQTRIAIDRFTSGVADTALFQEVPVRPKGTGANLTLEISLEDPQRAERALLLLVLRDVWTGRVPVGGESSIGRGDVIGVSGEIDLGLNPPKKVHLSGEGASFAAALKDADYKPTDDLDALETEINNAALGRGQPDGR